MTERRLCSPKIIIIIIIIIIITYSTDLSDTSQDTCCWGTLQNYKNTMCLSIMLS